MSGAAHHAKHERMKTCPAAVSANANIAPERRGQRCGKAVDASGFCYSHNPANVSSMRVKTAERHEARREWRDEAARAMIRNAEIAESQGAKRTAIFHRWAADALRRWRGPTKVPTRVDLGLDP